MVEVQLREFAQARSGDKDNTVNIGLFAPTDALFETLVREVTPKRVKDHFDGLVEGRVHRYQLPNIRALNFVCEQALGGGGSASIRMDNLGKCFGSNLLRMEVEVHEALLETCGQSIPFGSQNDRDRRETGPSHCHHALSHGPCINKGVILGIQARRRQAVRRQRVSK